MKTNIIPHTLFIELVEILKKAGHDYRETAYEMYPNYEHSYRYLRKLMRDQAVLRPMPVYRLYMSARDVISDQLGHEPTNEELVRICNEVNTHLSKSKEHIQKEHRMRGRSYSEEELRDELLELDHDIIKFHAERRINKLPLYKGKQNDK